MSERKSSRGGFKPRKEQAAKKSLHLMLTDEELAALSVMAKKAGVSKNSWMRQVIMYHAKRLPAAEIEAAMGASAEE